MFIELLQIEVAGGDGDESVCKVKWNYEVI